MATIWPKSGSFEFDNNGTAAPGALAYFYDAGTSTPRTVYQDAALSTAHTHPVQANGYGRWPAVFLQFGSYKSLLTTAGGTTLFTADNISNPEPVDTTASVDANAIFQTGDVIFVGKNGTREGFVRMNGRTLGSATSGATERANADCEDLFEYIWNNYANGQAGVSGGRGGSAAADWASNKTITIPDYRGAALTGFGDMGNLDAALYADAPVINGSGILAGSRLGSNTHTILTAQLPVTTPAGTINQVTGTITQSPITPAGTITQSPITPAGTIGLGTLAGSFPYSGVSNIPVGGSNTAGNPGGAGFNQSVTITGTATFTGTPQTLTFAGASQTLTFVGSTPTFTGTPFGSGAAHNIMQRSAPVTVLMKL